MELSCRRRQGTMQPGSVACWGYNIVRVLSTPYGIFYRNKTTEKQRKVSQSLLRARWLLPLPSALQMRMQKKVQE